MRFKYLKDPLFVFCFVLYFVNRWIFKPYLPNEFFRDHLNDMICIPFWIPIMLFSMRKVGLRDNDGTPSGGELLIPLILWSWVFEVWLPRTSAFQGLAISDHLDILYYAAGALFAALFWRFRYRKQPAAL
jgi:hypothetical protein